MTAEERNKPPEAFSSADDGPALLARAIAHAKMGAYDEAADLLARAVEREPASAEIRAQLGTVLLMAGRFARACDEICMAIELGSSNKLLWLQLAQALQHLVFQDPSPDIRAWLLRLLSRPGVPDHLLALPTLRYLAVDPGFGPLWACAQGPSFAVEDLRTVSDPLFIKLLERGGASNASFERVATAVRGRLIAYPVDRRQHPELLCAIAMAAIAREHAWFESPEETCALADLAQSIDEKVAADAVEIAPHIAIYAAFRPLHHAAWAPRLISQAWPPFFEKLFRRALFEPLREAEIARSLPVLGLSDNQVSDEVRRHYEENPYPRWIETADLPPESTPEAIRRLHPNAPLDGLRWSREPQILIAGCGTGRQAIEAAQRHPTGRVLALDLSRASLAYGARKADELGIGNIEFAQADILSVPRLGRCFDLVEAVGVLHHLEDPAKGWRALAEVTRSGGLMMIGLYSRRVRQQLARLRDASGGRPSDGHSPQALRAFRHRVLEAPQASPLVRIHDFYSLSDCRDLLFHEHEVGFTLDEVAELQAELGLRLVAMSLPPDVLRRYNERFPDDPSRTDLDRWSAFEAENPDSFAGMYQFWAVKRPGDGGQQSAAAGC